MIYIIRSNIMKTKKKTTKITNSHGANASRRATSIYFSGDEKELFIQAAIKENRSLSNFIAVAVNTYIDSKKSGI